MRKITLLLFLSALVVTSFAQLASVKVDDKFTFERPTFKGESDITDTLIPASFFSGTPTYYTASAGGYAFGTNGYGNSAVAQQYNEGALTVEGVQLWVGVNTIAEGNIKFAVWELVDGVPATEITSMDVPFAQVTPTNGETGAFMYSMIFDTPAEVTGEFVVGVTFDAALADGFTLIGTTNGDAEVSNMSWFNMDGWYTFADATNGWGLDVDVAVWPMVSPAPVAYELPYSEGFESGDLSGWTTLDEDGDGDVWAVFESADQSHGGSFFAVSASWSSANGPLTPENWLITPAINLTAETGAINLDYYVGPQDQDWPSEHYKLVVSTTGKAVEDFTTTLFEETIVVGDDNGFTLNTIDLSAYAGETIYLAWVHYQSTDWFRLMLDDVTIYAPSVEPTVYEVPFAENFDSVVVNADIDLVDWHNMAITGTKKWIGKTFNENSYAQFSSYSSSSPEVNEVWLATPEINLDATDAEDFSFDVNVGYFTHEGLSVMVSTNGGDTWEDVTTNFTIPTEPTSAYGTFASAGTMKLDSYTGKIMIAFVYNGDGNNSQTTTYQIDNVKVDFGDGVNQTKTSLVNLYPNPAKDVLNLNSVEGISQVIVSNLLGQSVLVKDAAKTINISELETGIYVVTLVSNNGAVQSTRIIKE